MLKFPRQELSERMVSWECIDIHGCSWIFPSGGRFWPWVKAPRHSYQPQRPVVDCDMPLPKTCLRTARRKNTNNTITLSQYIITTYVLALSSKNDKDMLQDNSRSKRVPRASVHRGCVRRGLGAFQLAYTRLVSNSAPTWPPRCRFTACHF